MTYRELLRIRRPECVSPLYAGGRDRCPGSHWKGAPMLNTSGCLGGSVEKCRRCWDSEIPEDSPIRNTSDIYKEAEDFCSRIAYCDTCPVSEACKNIDFPFSMPFSLATDDELMPIVEAIRKNNTTELLPTVEAVQKNNTKHDPVNHPSHYCRDGAMESIDEMRLIFGDVAVRHFCLCNAWKYRYRAADKNGAEDLAKSDWYIRKYKELKR